MRLGCVRSKITVLHTWQLGTNLFAQPWLSHACLWYPAAYGCTCATNSPASMLCATTTAITSRLNTKYSMPSRPRSCWPSCTRAAGGAHEVSRRCPPCKPVQHSFHVQHVQQEHPLPDRVQQAKTACRPS